MAKVTIVRTDEKPCDTGSTYQSYIRSASADTRDLCFKILVPKPTAPFAE